jgi:hypothetical protein
MNGIGGLMIVVPNAEGTGAIRGDDDVTTQ